MESTCKKLVTKISGLGIFSSSDGLSRFPGYQMMG